MNQKGYPPDVTAQIVTKETDVTGVWKGSREMVAKNVPLVSREMNVNNVLRDSREKIVRNVSPVSRVINVTTVTL